MTFFSYDFQTYLGNFSFFMLFFSMTCYWVQTAFSDSNVLNSDMVSHLNANSLILDVGESKVSFGKVKLNEENNGGRLGYGTNFPLGTFHEGTFSTFTEVKAKITPHRRGCGAGDEEKAKVNETEINEKKTNEAKLKQITKTQTLFEGKSLRFGPQKPYSYLKGNVGVNWKIKKKNLKLPSWYKFYTNSKEYKFFQNNLNGLKLKKEFFNFSKNTEKLEFGFLADKIFKNDTISQACLTTKLNKKTLVNWPSDSTSFQEKMVTVPVAFNSFTFASFIYAFLLRKVPQGNVGKVERKFLFRYNLGFLGIILANLALLTLLLLRWKESGHFPLSNLYESLMFLSWSCTLIHIFLSFSLQSNKLEKKLNASLFSFPQTLFSEPKVFPKTKASLIENLIGSIIAPCALFTNAFATFSLSKEMQHATALVPALRSNWLMMHVTVMILSYAALILGSLLAIAFLVITNNEEYSTQPYKPILTKLKLLRVGRFMRFGSIDSVYYSDTKTKKNLIPHHLGCGTIFPSSHAPHPLLCGVTFAFPLGKLEKTFSQKKLLFFQTQTSFGRAKINEAKLKLLQVQPFSKPAGKVLNFGYKEELPDVLFKNQNSLKLNNVQLNLLCDQRHMPFNNEIKMKQNKNFNLINFFFNWTQAVDNSAQKSFSFRPYLNCNFISFRMWNKGKVTLFNLPIGLKKGKINEAPFLYLNSASFALTLVPHIVKDVGQWKVVSHALQSGIQAGSVQFKSSVPPEQNGLQTEKNIKFQLAKNLDNLSYRILGIGFPFLTIGILSGAVWANEAWGSYWSWDPKETWALLTWFIFAIYLHTRLTKGWEGKKPALIASCGFITVWICFLGVNLIGEGLHSYGWFR